MIRDCLVPLAALALAAAVVGLSLAPRPCHGPAFCAAPAVVVLR